MPRRVEALCVDLVVDSYAARALRDYNCHTCQKFYPCAHLAVQKSTTRKQFLNEKTAFPHGQNVLYEQKQRAILIVAILTVLKEIWRLKLLRKQQPKFC